MQLYVSGLCISHGNLIFQKNEQLSISYKLIIFHIIFYKANIINWRKENNYYEIRL